MPVLDIRPADIFLDIDGLCVDRAEACRRRESVRNSHLGWPETSKRVRRSRAQTLGRGLRDLCVYDKGTVVSQITVATLTDEQHIADSVPRANHRLRGHAIGNAEAWPPVVVARVHPGTLSKGPIGCVDQRIGCW